MTCTAEWCCGKTCIRDDGNVRDPRVGVCPGCLDTQLASAHSAALEEAARECEAVALDTHDMFAPAGVGARECAERIRALKEKPPASNCPLRTDPATRLPRARLVDGRLRDAVTDDATVTVTIPAKLVEALREAKAAIHRPLPHDGPPYADRIIQHEAIDRACIDIADAVLAATTPTHWTKRAPRSRR